MKLSNEVEKVLNEQIGNEVNNSYQYCQIGYFLQSQGLDGFAKWAEKQSKGESDHASKIAKYLMDKQALPLFNTVISPKFAFGSAIEIFEFIQTVEQKTTEEINKIYRLAEAEKDYATMQFLLWFIEEQVEEEATVKDMITKLNLAGDDKAALLELDEQIGEEK